MGFTKSRKGSTSFGIWPSQSGSIFVPETLTPQTGFSIAYGGHDGITVENHWHCRAEEDAPYNIQVAETGFLTPVGPTPPDWETCRGFAEFDISGKAACTQALLKLRVIDVATELGIGYWDIGGIYSQDTAYEGDITIVVYNADGTAALADFDAAAVGTVANAFDTTGASVDQVFQADITTHYNTLIALSASAIGIKVQVADEVTDPLDYEVAITFDDLQIVLT